jgi:hypothetical protein
MMTDEEARTLLEHEFELVQMNLSDYAEHSFFARRDRAAIAAILSAAADVERRTTEQIVEWLRANPFRNYGSIADAIERGDHRSLSEHSSRGEE